MHSTSSKPAAVTLGVPTFTPKELHKQLDAVLGKGASGTVYSLRDFPGLAAKEILLDGLDQHSIDATKLELATLPTLSHPGILRYHQVIEDESFVYIVMDRHDTSLGTLITKHRRWKEPVPAETIVALTVQIAGALAYLHGFCGTDVDGRPYQGIVHRDLKPDNVLVAADGEQFILADFGLCKDALRSGTTLAGTKPYMAPETLLYNSTSPASDIWALGVIIYELATLKRPNFLEGREPKDVFIDGWKPDLSDVKNDFIRGILERIFVLDPAKRPPAKELASLLQKSDVSGNRQQAYGTSLEDRCMFLEAILKDANARIAALEGQCKEHLAIMKTLENKIALLTTSNPQSELLLLPRLMRAAHTNSIETVRMLAEGGDWVSKRDEQGRTALMHAAQQGHVEPARLLVEKEQGLQDRSGWTALMHAVHNNHPGVVEILTAHECGKRDNSRRTALMIAAERGRTEIVAALAPHEKGLVDSSGNTALMLAASNVHTEAVRVLVEHEKGARDTRGRTALMTAAQRGDLEMVRVLAEHEKGVTDEDGHTALVHAARNSHRDIAELLMEHEKDVTGWTTLMCAAVLGDVDMVSQYINERGQKDKRGQTALIIAAQNRRDDAVKLLIKHEGGVSGWTSLICAAYLGDINAVRDNLHEKGYKDVTGMTALMWVAERGYKEAVEILIEHEKGMRDNQNHNALYHALKSGYTEVAKVILPHDDPTDENGVTALMRAAARGDTEMVELLAPLQKGAKDKDGTTAFAHALKNRHTDIAMVLREHEVLSWTPLMSAAVTGDIETAKQHLSDKDKKNSDGDTAYTLAAKAGQGTILELLDPTDKNGVTALMRATERDDIEAVRALMHLQKRRAAKCVMINGRSASHGTALMMAAACGHADVVGLLVEHEAGMKDTTGQTALMFATNNGHTECVRLLVDRESGIKENKGENALMFAALNGHRECVKLLLEETCMQDNDGVTALMYAAQQGHKVVVEVLLEHEKGIVDNKGNTAFMHALKNKYEDIALLLRECEAPSWTPLMCAAFTGDIELAKRHLSDKDKKNNKGETALMIAARMGYEGIVEIIDPTDYWGVTALMRAAARGNVDAVRALIPLQKGRKANNVKINGRDTSDGGTALMLAAARGYAEVVKLLVEYEGGIKDEDGWTALMYAAENGYKECVRLLVERERNMETTREWDIFPPGTTALDIAKEREYRGIISIICNRSSTSLLSTSSDDSSSSDDSCRSIYSFVIA